MREHKVGIIGYGFMGKTHTYGYKTIPLFYADLPYRVTLGTICTRREHIAREAMEQQGFEKFTTDAEEIFNDPDIDIVSVCTPNNSHADYVIRALKAGKNVYCDKPLTATAEEARTVLKEAAKHPGLVTQMALQSRFYPAVMRAKQMIEDGRIGSVFHFRSEYLHSSGIDPYKALGWKQMKEYGGGGVQLDLGAHAFDLIYYLLGKFDKVETRKTIIFPQRPDASGKLVDVDAEDSALSIVKMSCGCEGEIFVSKVATGAMDELSFDIRGEKGALRFNTSEPGYLYYYDATAAGSPYGGEQGFTRIDCHQKYEAPGGAFPNPRFTLGFLRAHVACLFNFVDCVDRGVTATPSFEDGAYIQSIISQ